MNTPGTSSVPLLTFAWEESRLCSSSSSALAYREREIDIRYMHAQYSVLMWRKRSLCGSRFDCLSSRIRKVGRVVTTLCSWLVSADGTIGNVCLKYWLCCIIHLFSPFLMSKGSLKWKFHNWEWSTTDAILAFPVLACCECSNLDDIQLMVEKCNF